MLPVTLHDVGVITKLYFVILWHLKNLAQMSFKVIQYGGNRKPMYDLI